MNLAQVRIVSSNPGKVREIRAVLAEYGVRASWVRRALAEPQADDLSQVLDAKLASLPSDGHCYLVEDSGIFLDGLGGFPGVYSAYVYRTLGLRGVLAAVRGRDRRATFRTLAGARIGHRTWRAEGAVRGRVCSRPRGDGGFGYDPIFVPDRARRTFAEMEPREKDRRSHRALAVRALLRAMAIRPRDPPDQM